MAAMGSESTELLDCLICFKPFSTTKKLTRENTLCNNCVNQTHSSNWNCNSSVAQSPKPVDLVKSKDNFTQEGNFTRAQDYTHAETYTPGENKFSATKTELISPEIPLVVEGKYRCELCQNNPLSYICTDCEQWICGDCRVIHLRAKISKLHSVVSLADELQRIKSHLRIDDIFACLNNNFHEFQTTLKQIEKAIKQSMEIQANSLALINNIRCMCIAEINNVFDSFNTQIIKFMNDRIQGFEREKVKLEIQLRNIELNCFKVQNLMKEDNPDIFFITESDLQGIQELIESTNNPTIRINNPNIQIAKNQMWKATDAVTLELTGGLISIQTNQSISAMPDTIHKKNWLKQSELWLTEYPFSIRVINKQLWCCHREGITVLDNKLKIQHILGFHGVGAVHDVVQLRNSELFVAARNGLYHMTTTGEKILNIIDNTEYFSSVQAHDEHTIYAANCNTKSEIRVYKLDNSWAHVETIALPCGRGHWVTMSVKDNEIKACCATESKIYMLSMDGQLQRTFKTYGKSSHGVAKLNYPYICDDYANNMVFVADCNNDLVHILDSTAQWSALDLKPRINKPCSIVRYKDWSKDLYVVSNAYPYKIYKYIVKQ